MTIGCILVDNNNDWSSVYNLIKTTDPSFAWVHSKSHNPFKSKQDELTTKYGILYVVNSKR